MTKLQNIRDESWISRLNRIETFIEKHNRFPNRFDKNESADYEFLRTQRYKLQKNILLEKRITTLKEFINKHQHFLRKTQTYWQLRLNEIEEFIEQHNRLPSQLKKEEKPKCQFLNLQRYNLKNNLLSQERIRPFKAFLKKYKKHFPQKERFIERLKSIEAFIQKHKREPSHVIEEEMSNAKFLWRQKTKFKHNLLSQERVLPFKAFLSKCQQYFTQERHKSWQPRLNSISLFIEKHNRIPSHAIKEEQSDAKFLNLQRYKLKHNLLLEERILPFKAFYKKHQQHFTKKPDESWISRLNRIETFIEKHNRFPNRFDKNESSDYDFLNTQKTNLKNNLLLEERIIPFKAFLNKHQYLSRKITTDFASRLQSISLFIEQHNRLPSQLKKEENSEYQFLLLQRTRFKNNLLSQERILPFKAFMKKHKRHFLK